ncbi:Ubiquitin-fold modifier 1 [Manis javanica]|nr:Ubiquitin-fold modifier 1 [Manis javanica]
MRSHPIGATHDLSCFHRWRPKGTTGLQVRNGWRIGPTCPAATAGRPAQKHGAPRRGAPKDCDIALLCLPDEAAREAVALVHRPGVRVIDAVLRIAPRRGGSMACRNWRRGPNWKASPPARPRQQSPCYPTGLLDHEGAAAATAVPLQVYGLGLHHKHVPEIQQLPVWPMRRCSCRPMATTGKASC